MDRRVVEILNGMPERNRFVRGIRSWVGLDQVGLAYERQARYAGREKYSYRRLVYLALDGLISFSFVPLRMITVLGFVVSAISIVLAIVYTIQKLTVGLNPPGFATTIVAIFFLAGMQLITHGRDRRVCGAHFRRSQAPPAVCGATGDAGQSLMRILMLNNEFPPLGGGTGTVNRAILQRLAGVADLEIDLITSALGRQREVEDFAERIHIDKVPVHNRDIHHSRNRELTLYALRALRMARQLHQAHPYDFCFAWSAVPAGAVALVLRRLAGLRYLVRVCGPDIPGFEQRYGPLYPILSPTIRAVWHGAEVIVAKCEGEAEMIRQVDRAVKIDWCLTASTLTRSHPPRHWRRRPAAHLVRGAVDRTEGTASSDRSGQALNGQTARP